MGGGGDGSGHAKEYLVAGGTAGVVARTCIAPIERVKILFQVSHGTVARSYWSSFPRIVREEGFLAFWKGNSAGVIRVVPYMSITFLTYEETKRQLRRTGAAGQSADAANVLAGSAAGLVAVGTTYPLDIVRARLALQTAGAATTNYRGVADALVSIPRQEGFFALYKGMSATMMGVAPYQGLKFGAYELLKRTVRGTLGVEERDLSMVFRVGCGALAGLAAQTVVYPFDVVRRRTQAHREGRKYSSVLQGLATIAREEGVTRGLYRGLTLNFAKTLPNVAIYMSLYDFIKLRLLS